MTEEEFQLQSKVESIIDDAMHSWNPQYDYTKAIMDLLKAEFMKGYHTAYDDYSKGTLIQ